MTSSDGSVLGTTKIVNRGPASSKWNLVLVSEGYQSTEMTTWHTHADDFVTALFSTPPFDEVELSCAINVYRIDVTSTDSGADDPNPCGTDTNGSGATPATYFDGRFCSDGVIRRLPAVDTALVSTVVNAEVPEWDQVVVVINSTVSGGSGGQIAVTTTDPGWELTAIHEIGHSAFGLADEYEYYQGCSSGETDRDTYSGSEPSEPNVTINTDRTTIKWASLINAATAMPTSQNANCSICDNQSNPVATGTVGAFEGGRYFHCGIFRPTFDCMMRNFAPFCPVCVARIRETMAPYVLGSVTLETPAITFNDVPESETTVRAITFRAHTCVGLTFQIVSGPTVLTGPAATVFSTPMGTSAATVQDGASDVARLWIGYTGTTAGDMATGTVRVLWVETGQEWDVPITALTVARPSVAVVLVLDQSASMDWDAGDGRTRVQVLRDSATPFVDLIQENNAIGVVRFDHDPHPAVPVQAVGPLVFGVGRNAARSAVLGHNANPAGNTAIGDGVELGHNTLDPVTGYDAKAMIVLTDGQETAAKYISDVMPLINDRVFAIGLGTAEAIQPAALTALTNGTGGYLLMTGSIDSDDYFRLAKYYLQILAGVTNVDIVLDPEAYLAPGDTHKIPFRLNETEIGDDVILLSPNPELFDFLLVAPDGTEIDPGMAGATPGMSYVMGDNVAFYRAVFPVPLPSGPASDGEWTAVIRINEKYFKRYLYSLEQGTEAWQEAVAHGARYSLSVHALSNLRFRARLDQTGQEPGALMTVTAVLTEYGLPVEDRAVVDADVERPNGSTSTLAMTEVDPGIFELTIPATMSGVYHFRLRANGTTLRDRPFVREQLLTGAVWKGGDGDLPTDGGGGNGSIDPCTWIRCLLQSGFITPEFEERMRAAGLDLDALRKCVERHCPTKLRGLTTSAIPVDVVEAFETLRRAIVNED